MKMVKRETNEILFAGNLPVGTGSLGSEKNKKALLRAAGTGVSGQERGVLAR